MGNKCFTAIQLFFKRKIYVEPSTDHLLIYDLALAAQFRAFSPRCFLYCENLNTHSITFCTAAENSTSAYSIAWRDCQSNQSTVGGAQQGEDVTLKSHKDTFHAFMKLSQPLHPQRWWSHHWSRRFKAWINISLLDAKTLFCSIIHQGNRVRRRPKKRRSKGKPRYEFQKLIVIF